MTHRPTVYTASKVFRAPMWRDLRANYPDIEFTARWIDAESLNDKDAEACRQGWIKNIEDVRRSDHLLCLGIKSDPEPLSGTLVEIGAMLAVGGSVWLIGDYDWKTWHHHPQVKTLPLLIFSPDYLCAAVLDRIQRGDRNV